MVKDYVFTILSLYDLKQWSSKEKHLRVSSEALNPLVTQMLGPLQAGLGSRVVALSCVPPGPPHH